MKMGDMIDIKSNQYIKGLNTFSPCQKCQIQGCRDPNHSLGNYYYPLKAPQGAIHLNKSPRIDYDAHDLPMCTDEGCKEALANILAASTAEERKCREKVHSLKGESILLELPGFSRIRSVPHDLMHLLFKNIIPNRMDLWSGSYKGLDEGSRDYKLPANVWSIVVQKLPRLH
ncbi:hypothetical protein M422DRAFT_49687 [Sphaerobolus stellatus SS14]|uniref:Uncharacterized protein n=1 Tax=Sphaerobolus stellatus (strain SS14) TaxID=990650 RepID=A0A0C9VNI0_SPHS4|nr:hypothetical protein M422DRAFT_49687 [Sphaerobolus stellatus SS14]